MLRPYQTSDELPFNVGDVITLRAIETKYADTYKVLGFEMKNELYVRISGGVLRASFLCYCVEILINGEWRRLGVRE